MSFEHPTVYIATYSSLFACFWGLWYTVMGASSEKKRKCKLPVQRYHANNRDMQLNISTTILTIQIDVYECLAGDAPIMRRCKDNWVNATQILKLCDFPKAKRTKILEKGVQKGLHEKVQGGYGRFQGTWIPLAEAQKLAQEYNITPEMAPVLYIDVSDPSTVILRKGKGLGAAKESTPQKRKYTRKPPSGTPKKGRFEDHMPALAVFTQNYGAKTSMPMGIPMGMQMGMQGGQSSMGPPQGEYADAGPQSGAFTHYPMVDTNFGPASTNFGHANASFSQNTSFAQNDQSFSQNDQSFTSDPGFVPPAPLSSHSFNKRVFLAPRTTEAWSQEEQPRDLDTSLSLADHKITDELHAAQLLRFFSVENAPIPYFLYASSSGFDVNEPIDDEGHAALHWAAAIGNVTMLHLLLQKGASPLVVSSHGMSPLSKCLAFTNCFDTRRFPSVVAALEPCLINTDVNGRTPLHYLCQLSKVPHKLPALLYYAGEIFARLEVMARRGARGVNLLQNVLDHQDVNGDTCLHLAARARCVPLVEYLMQRGARDDLPDRHGTIAKALVAQLPFGRSYDPGMQGPMVGRTFVAGNRGALRSLGGPVQVGSTVNHGAAMEGGTDNQVVPAASVGSFAALGTPIQCHRPAETPDTQRTTVQEEDDDDEIHDHVSKDALRDFLGRHNDENKENVFDDGHMHTPKQTPVASGPRLPMLSVKSETLPPPAPVIVVSNHGAHSPHPPPLDTSGRPVQEAQENGPASPLPMTDVAAMVAGMIRSLLTSYEDQLGGLRAEQRRVRAALAEKRRQNSDFARRAAAVLSRHGVRGPAALDDALAAADSESGRVSQALELKEAQFQATVGKWQAYELASVVERCEQEAGDAAAKMEGKPPIETEKDDEEKWALGTQLGRAQMRRRRLAGMLAGRVRDFAVTPKMNKYRRLISLSCGLKMEDIDGLIEGIEESLAETASAG